jgi:outer membrane receptor protein involved in Fe transport
MGGKSSFMFKFCLFSVFLTFISTSLVVSSPVFAQDDEEEFTLEEIVVTGSRIQRANAESNSPIVTIEAEEFEMQSNLNIESYLNQMPEYNPAATPTTRQMDVQITPVNSVGVATIALRGLGTHRSLTLIDGKRDVPVNARMWTDINGIPSFLIERSETISGGASAVYGADAMGGVTNIIMKKNFEGAEVDASYSMPQAGDGETSRMYMLMGTNFAEDRGNITFGASRYERKEALKRERDWYRKRWADPNASGNMMFQGVHAYACSPNCPNWGALKALYSGQNPHAWYRAGLLDSDVVPGGQFGVPININPDGTIYVGGNAFGESRSTVGKDSSLRFADRLAMDNQDMLGEATYVGTKYNNIDEWASAPQERYSFYTAGHYDVTDKVTLFGGARFAESKTKTLLFGQNLNSGWSASVPYDPTTDSPIDPTLDYTDPAVLAAVGANPVAFFAANPNPNFIPTGTAGAGHPVTPEIAWLLNSRRSPVYDDDGTTIIDWIDRSGERWVPNLNTDTSIPMRQTTNTIQSWMLDGGLEFEIPFRDWTGEAYFSHGQSSTYNAAPGNLSLARYRALMNLPDWGRNAEGQGNYFYPVDTVGDGNINDVDVLVSGNPGFGAAMYKCTSGFYDVLFSGDQPLSEDCLNAVSALLQTRTEMTQDIYELNFQGGLFNLPAGEVRAAAGYQFRKVRGKFIPDVLQSTNSFTDQVAGVYPTGYMDNSTTVNDAYVEALVPVLSDLPLIKKVELELGARHSDYKETGDKEWTYKTMGNWQVNDWFRFRGGYNRAIRAPNLGELFLAQQETFQIGGNNYGDACSVRSIAPWGAGGTTLAEDEQIDTNELPPALAPGQTLAGADYTQQLCEAMMGQTAADDYYRGIVGGVDGIRNVGSQGGGGFFNWVQMIGNPELKPESADTWTAGFVLNSPLENPLVSGITLSFDYYNIKIEDAIMLYSIDYANYRCFGTGMDAGLTPAEQAATTACQLVPRNVESGGPLSAMLSYDNQATIDTSGFDIMLNWHADVAAMGLNIPGFLNFNVKATVLDSYVTRQSPAVYDVPTEWKGSFGPNIGGMNGGSYDYRLTTNLTYDNVRYPWRTTLTWRHLPGIWSAGHASQQAIIKNNKAVAAGADGIILAYEPRTDIKTDSYDVFNLNGSWDITDKVTLRFGIDNLFETKPRSIGSTAGYNPEDTPDLSAVCSEEEEALGCTDPAAYSVPNIADYNGGFYDIIGRTFFMGVKVRF